MRRRWLLALLFVSLAFNFAFMGGFVYHRWQVRKPPRPERVFDEARRNELRASFDAFREESRSCREDYSAARAAFISELRSPAFEASRAESLLAVSVQRHSDMEEQIGRHFMRLRQEMSEQEAERFFEHMMRKLPPMNGGPNEPNPDDHCRPGRFAPREPRGPGMERL